MSFYFKRIQRWHLIIIIEYVEILKIAFDICVIGESYMGLYLHFNILVQKSFIKNILQVRYSKFLLEARSRTYILHQRYASLAKRKTTENSVITSPRHGDVAAPDILEAGVSPFRKLHETRTARFRRSN